MCGAFPSRVDSYAPVFVDSRNVCYPLQIRASRTGTMPLSVFLNGVGLLLPNQRLLEVSGSVRFDRRRRLITVCDGDTVCLRKGSIPAEAFSALHSGSFCIDLDPDSSSDQDRSPRRTTSAAAPTPEATCNALVMEQACPLGQGHASPSCCVVPEVRLLLRILVHFCDLAKGPIWPILVLRLFVSIRLSR